MATESLQSAVLTEERWRGFDFGHQIVIIANELHRAGKLNAPAQRGRRRASLERTLALADLAIRCADRVSRLRELTRWRELLAESYLEETTPAERQRELMRGLLRLSPAAAKQLAALTP